MVEFTAKFGLKVGMSGDSFKVSVTVPSMFKNQVYGFCGDYDGNAKDDLTLSNGTNVALIKDFGDQIGSSYAVLNDPDNKNNKYIHSNTRII